MVSMLIEGTTHLPPLFGDSNFPFLDICGAGRELAAPDKGRALMSHLAFRYLPRDVEDKRVKIIYLVRNPKDATVSLYHHVGSTLPPIRYEGSWDQFLTTVLEQGCKSSLSFIFLSLPPTSPTPAPHHLLLKAILLSNLVLTSSTKTTHV